DPEDRVLELVADFESGDSEEHEWALRSGRSADVGQGREIDVLEAAFDRLEARGLPGGEHVNDVLAGKETSGDDVVFLRILLELRMRDRFLPHLAAGGFDKLGRLALELDA